MLVVRISLTLSRHFSLSFIASGRSSGLHPVSSHSCWIYVHTGHPAFARPYVGVHKSTSLMSSSLLLQQCPACLVRLTWIVFVIGGRWPYSWVLPPGLCFNIYIYIYIVIHRQICFVLSELISVATQARFSKLGLKPDWLKCQSKILPLSHEETSFCECVHTYSHKHTLTETCFTLSSSLSCTLDCTSLLSRPKVNLIIFKEVKSRSDLHYW